MGRIAGTIGHLLFSFMPDNALDSGKSQQNAFIESFNGSLRDELLNEEMFDSLDDARRKVALSLLQEINQELGDWRNTRHPKVITSPRCGHIQ